MKKEWPLARTALIGMSAIGVTLSLAGCATLSGQEQASTDEVRAALVDKTVVVMPPEQPVQLAERTKGRAVANTLIASMAATAAANMGSAGSIPEAQAHQAIATDFGTQVARTLSEADLIEEGTGIDRAFAHRLARFFETQAPKAVEDEIIVTVDAAKWELGYESFLTSSDYRLDYAIDVHVTESAAAGERSHRLKTIECAGTFDRKMPLDQWRADAYHAVDAAAQDIVDRCYDRALAGMGMT
ncbi:hypothetical protein [Guyparkeria halopsychrophila]|uniref:hypothetical protein n=1 Tax=Guyparkeria halopsychrophila TaxID=3139421 RepID=UPI0037C8BB17